MPGFTNTTLLSLVVAAIGRVAPELGVGLDRPDPMKAGVSSDHLKTGLLRDCAARHGRASLLRIGQHLDLTEESPVLAVLTMSPDPAVLASKWMRLESYHHSSHRTGIDYAQGNQWLCHRTSTAAPPSPEENLLIAGILLGLLEMLGAQGGRISFGHEAVTPEQFDSLALQGDCARFSITWSSDRACRTPQLSRSGDVCDRLTNLLVADIGRSWKLAHAAHELAYSQRSLQRHLARTGRSFSSVLRRARMRAATHLLMETNTSLAEIGYCCGYADQAHFQRDFRRVGNMTPRLFRAVSRQNGAMLQ